MYRLVKKPEEGPGWRREVFAVPVPDSEFDGRRPFKDSDIQQRAVLKLLIHSIPFDKAYTIVLLHEVLEKVYACRLHGYLGGYLEFPQMFKDNFSDRRTLSPKDQRNFGQLRNRDF